MSSSSSSSTSPSPTSVPPKVTINEKVNLTKEQNEVLQMICNSYEMTISEYMQQALVEAMRFDIEEGNFSDILLEKLGEDNGKKKTNELDKLHKQQMSY
jgi:hypothetical protein